MTGQAEDDDMPLFCAGDVLDEYATEEEFDYDMDTLFWGWYGWDEGEEDDE